MDLGNIGKLLLSEFADSFVNQLSLADKGRETSKASDNQASAADSQQFKNAMQKPDEDSFPDVLVGLIKNILPSFIEKIAAPSEDSSSEKAGATEQSKSPESDQVDKASDGGFSDAILGGITGLISDGVGKILPEPISNIASSLLGKIF